MQVAFPIIFLIIWRMGQSNQKTTCGSILFLTHPALIIFKYSIKGSFLRWSCSLSFQKNNIALSPSDVIHIYNKAKPYFLLYSSLTKS